MAVPELEVRHPHGMVVPVILSVIMADSGVFPELVGTIYDCVLLPERWPAVLDTIQREVGALSSYLIIHQTDPRAPAMSVLVEHNVDARMQRQYQQHYVRRNPLLPHLASTRDGNIYTCRHLVTQPEYLRGEFYQEWAAPQGWFDYAGVTMIRQDQASAAIGFTRGGPGNIFDDASLDLLQRLAPHLTRSGKNPPDDRAGGTVAHGPGSFDRRHSIRRLDCRLRVARSGSEWRGGRLACTQRGPFVQGSRDSGGRGDQRGPGRCSCRVPPQWQRSSRRNSPSPSRSEPKTPGLADYAPLRSGVGGGVPGPPSFQSCDFRRGSGKRRARFDRDPSRYLPAHHGRAPGFGAACRRGLAGRDLPGAGHRDAHRPDSPSPYLRQNRYAASI